MMTYTEIKKTLKRAKLDGADGRLSIGWHGRMAVALQEAGCKVGDVMPTTLHAPGEIQLSKGWFILMSTSGGAYLCRGSLSHVIEIANEKPIRRISTLVALAKEVLLMDDEW